MSEQTEKKKYLLIGLCSVLLLGSAGTYAAYKQTEKKIQSESVEKQGKQPVKKTNRSWEKQVTEKEKNKNREEHKREKKRSVSYS